MRDRTFFLAGGGGGGQLARFRFFGKKNNTFVHYHFIILWLELVLRA